jgi:hypothetical protein
MRVQSNNTVMLVGDVRSALAARKALRAARDVMPDGEDRDEIIGLMVHLRYAIDQAKATMDERELEAVMADLEDA